MNSVLIGTHQMDVEFGLYLPEYSIPAPVPQTKFINVIGRDGAVDLSNAFGSVHYNSREWNLDFKHFDPVNWHTISSSVFNAIHGKRLDFIFDDDPNYHWTGRFIVQDYTSKNGCGTLKVKVMADPFKYKNTQTTVSSSVPVGEQTLTGDIVTINNNKAYEVDSLSVSLTPIQDLHGYPSPWPAGGGVNLLPADYTESITVSKVFLFDTPLPAGQYTLSFISADTSSQVDSYQLGRYRDETGSYVYTAVNPTQGFATFTNTEPCSKIVLFSNKAYNESAGFTTVFTGLMFKAGGRGTYSPYSNICPISGRTGLSVYRRGKNLLNAATNVTGYYINSSGVINQDSGTPSSQYTDLIPVEVGKIYTLSLISNRTNSGNNRVHGYDSNGNWVQEINHAAPAVGSDVPFELTGTIYSGISYVRISYGINDVEAMYEEGNSQTSYEPFAYNAYDEDWSTQAGTVYHGTVDPVVGQLTVDWASISSYAGETLPGAWISDRDVYAPGASPTTGAQVVYELATPITYQLTAQEVALLVGTNNIWSSGQVSVVITEPIVINNPTLPVAPTVTASAPMTLKWNAQSYSMDAGTRVIPQLTLQTGNNPIYVDGEGTISFAFSEASL